MLQTESEVREEFKLAEIGVESRTFPTDGDPTTVIEDLFVSCSDMHVSPTPYTYSLECLQNFTVVLNIISYIILHWFFFIQREKIRTIECSL